MRRLDEVANQISKLIGVDDQRAASLYEAFLAGCLEKANELDDSSGSFGQFAKDLICGWIRARASNPDAEGTADRLLAWMDNDPYAFCYQIEQHAVKAFTKAGLAAFEKRIRTRFEEATATKPESDYSRRQWSGVLRTIYAGQRNVAAYLALAEETGLTAEDCHTLATLFVARRKPNEALDWVKRGIARAGENSRWSPGRSKLAALQRELLTKLGRGTEARDSAWAEFVKDPSKYSYRDLMKFVPKADRGFWHEKAMDAASAADLHSLLDLFVATNETDRLAGLVRDTQDVALEQVSHYGTEPAAKKLQKAYPGLAARLWRAQAMRIIDAGKSKYYDAALSNFERAKRCYKRAGLEAEWEETVRHVRTNHSRKTGFMAGFDDIVRGSSKVANPSFLERAKARWSGV